MNSHLALGSRVLIYFCSLGLLAVSMAAAAGDEPVDYARDIKPILKARCYACHGALKQESSLRLDTGALARKGGDSGPAIVPGHADESLLMTRVAARDAGERMPPEGEPLNAEQIDALRRWIDAGAPSPGDELPEPDPREHWAFKKPVRPSLPSGLEDGAVHPIDAFILRSLGEQGLSPRPEASKPILLRRVYLDLIGLPPTPEELRAFLADDSPDAYERVVDRLLDDPRHGERWARHWMDVWRYSDWYGRRHVPDVWNSAPQIWRWRDWIVASLNADHGYDRMVREMLAADEIVPEDYEAGYATGYLVRNWYALNPNDWMRSTVEHSAKAFLALTFNCAHCHDHKYDPIEQDDYFRLRAYFEPIYVRQDRVPGEADPGPFQDYEYSKLRKIQRLGAVRVFDKNPEAPTWFYTGGDERNRVVQRGSMAPGVPRFLAEFAPEIVPLDLPPRAWYPALRPEIQETIRSEAAAALASAERARDQVRSDVSAERDAAQERLAQAEAEFHRVSNDPASQAQTALCGTQSLVFDASEGRRILHHKLTTLTSLDDRLVVEFQVKLLTNAHFNFQFAKDVVKGLTAGYVAFDQGRIVSYQPGTFTEFEVGRYDFDGRQTTFHVQLTLRLEKDDCLLTVRSLSDDRLLADEVPVALNGWNPVGDPTKAISFDARSGSVAMVDDLCLSAPAIDGSSMANRIERVRFDFEPPHYVAGADVVGKDGWEASPFGVAPAFSQVATSAGTAAWRDASRNLDRARRAVELPLLRLRAAEAKVEAARAGLADVTARIAADNARYGETKNMEVGELTRAAGHAERTAVAARAESAMAAAQLALAEAESRPLGDEQRAKHVETARKQLSAAQATLAAARAALEDSSQDDTYSPLSPVYPRTSTGRRRAIAGWFTSKENPLTARVAVNHIWMRHFHEPLVATVYDFGRNGARPTHPELLDWLAVEFMESGWSMKHLHRLIVTSQTYRRSSSVGDATQSFAIDPDNHFLWRMNARRMEAEVLRDSLLYCAGRLDPTVGGQELENDQAMTTFRRSLYYSVHPEEGGKSEFARWFDAPDALECYRRTESIVPQQALAMTNSELVHAMSEAVVADDLGDHAVEHESLATADRAFVDRMFLRILSREPSDAERELCLAALAEQRTLLAREQVDLATAFRSARESLVRALFNHNEFITIR